MHESRRSISWSARVMDFRTGELIVVNFADGLWKMKELWKMIGLLLLGDDDDRSA